MTSQSAARQSPSGAGRAEPGAASRAPGWGRGRRAVERECARPSPRSAAAGPGAMEPDNSPRKIQFTVPLLEPHLDPEAAEQVQAGRGSGLGEGLGTWQWDLNPCLAPARHRTSSGTHSPSLWGSPYPPPTAEPRLVTSTGPCGGCLWERRSLPAQPWGHDPSFATGDLTTPHTQSTPRVSRLGGIAKLKGTAGRVRRAGGGRAASGQKRQLSSPPSHPHLGSECGTQGVRTAMEEFGGEGGGGGSTS